MSIRRGWFWHPDQEPKSLDELLEIYFKSVGRNCLLLLNVPPNRDSLISEEEVARLREFREALDGIFATDFAEGSEAASSSVWGDDPERFGAAKVLDGQLDTYWAPAEGVHSGSIFLELPNELTFDVIGIQEPIAMGQRVSGYRVEVWADGVWQIVSRGTTIGYRKLDRLDSPVTTSRVRVTVEEARAEPLLATVGLFSDLSRQ